jgi:uncharacterized membrane protein YqhA
MGKLKFNGLALALMTLIIVISAVNLLEALIEKGQASDHELGRHAAVFFVFVVSTLLFAVSDLLQRSASR